MTHLNCYPTLGVMTKMKHWFCLNVITTLSLKYFHLKRQLKGRNLKLNSRYFPLSSKISLYFTAANYDVIAASRYLVSFNNFTQISFDTALTIHSDKGKHLEGVIFNPFICISLRRSNNVCQLCMFIWLYKMFRLKYLRS